MSPVYNLWSILHIGVLGFSACLCKMSFICVFAWLDINYMQVHLRTCCMCLCHRPCVLFPLSTRLLPPTVCTWSVFVSCCTMGICCCWVITVCYCNEFKIRTDCNDCVAFIWQNIFLHRSTCLSVVDIIMIIIFLKTVLISIIDIIGFCLFACII